MKVVNIYMLDEVLLLLLTGKRICENCKEKYNIAEIHRKGYEV